MKLSMRWHDHKRIVLLVGLFAGCCYFAMRVHALVENELVGDLAAVLLQASTLLIFLGLAVFAFRAGRRSRGRLEYVALRVLPIVVLVVAATFAKTGYAGVSIALHALADRGETPPPTTIVLGPGGRDVRLSGDLTDGAAMRLASLLKSHPKVERIVLTSDGGLAEEGEALRNLISANKLTTFVPDNCISACTLAFLGGRERFIMSDAKLGFHAPYEEGLFGQTFAGDNSAERASYLAAGVGADFVEKAMAVAPSDIWTPDADRLIAAHVVTGVVDRYRFPDSNLDGNDNAAGARRAVLENFPLAGALVAKDAQALDKIAAWYLDAYRQGRSEGAIVDGIDERLDDLTFAALAKADDETLVGLGRFVATAMQAAQSEEDCVAIGSEGSLIAAETGLNDSNKSADVIAVALFARALETQRAGAKPAQVSSKTAATALAASDGGCKRLRAYYKEALNQRRSVAAARIRALVAGRAMRADVGSPDSTGD